MAVQWRLVTGRGATFDEVVAASSIRMIREDRQVIAEKPERSCSHPAVGSFRFLAGVSCRHVSPSLCRRRAASGGVSLLGQAFTSAAGLSPEQEPSLLGKPFEAIHMAASFAGATKRPPPAVDQDRLPVFDLACPARLSGRSSKLLL